MLSLPSAFDMASFVDFGSFQVLARHDDARILLCHGAVHGEVGLLEGGPFTFAADAAAPTLVGDGDPEDTP